MTKTYVGTYTGGEYLVSVEENGTSRPLPLCLDLRNHSPTGFCWGYGGSGPAQLALAIMCDMYGKPRHEEQLRGLHPIHYQDLKFGFVAKLDPRAGWRATADEIRDVIVGIQGR